MVLGGFQVLLPNVPIARPSVAMLEDGEMIEPAAQPAAVRVSTPRECWPGSEWGNTQGGRRRCAKTGPGSRTHASRWVSGLLDCAALIKFFRSSERLRMLRPSPITITPPERWISAERPAGDMSSMIGILIFLNLRRASKETNSTADLSEARPRGAARRGRTAAHP